MSQKKNSAHDAAGILLRIAENWSAILLATVLCAAALFSYGRFAVPARYTSTAVLYTLDQNAGDSAYDTETGIARDCAYAAGSQAVLGRVIKDLNLSYTYRELADMVEVGYPEGSHVVEITVTDSNSEHAKKLADAIADATVAYVSEEMRQNSPRVLSYGFTGGRTISVSPMMFAISGAAAGLILSILVCLARAFSDDRILVPGDLSASGLEVISIMPGKE